MERPVDNRAVGGKDQSQVLAELKEQHAKAIDQAVKDAPQKLAEPEAHTEGENHSEKTVIPLG